MRRTVFGQRSFCGRARITGQSQFAQPASAIAVTFTSALKKLSPELGLESYYLLTSASFVLTDEELHVCSSESPSNFEIGGCKMSLRSGTNLCSKLRAPS